MCFVCRYRYCGSKANFFISWYFYISFFTVFTLFRNFLGFMNFWQSVKVAFLPFKVYKEVCFIFCQTIFFLFTSLLYSFFTFFVMVLIQYFVKVFVWKEFIYFCFVMTHVHYYCGTTFIYWLKYNPLPNYQSIHLTDVDSGGSLESYLRDNILMVSSCSKNVLGTSNSLNHIYTR